MITQLEHAQKIVTMITINKKKTLKTRQRLELKAYNKREIKTLCVFFNDR